MADDAEIRRRNLRRLFPGTPFPASELVRRLGRSPAFWSDLNRGRKSFGEKLARSIEEEMGLARLSLDDAGAGDRAALADASRPIGGVPSYGGPHAGGANVSDLNDIRPILLPSTVDWETIAMGQIPERFILAMPDDALAPQTPRGTELIFVAGDTPPRYGVGVLVEDSAGARYVRRWVQGPGSGWAGEARNSAYRSITSASGGKVLAWVQGRLDGDV